MRILGLYDIHANPEALTAVLDDSRAASPDAVVVGGDAVPGAFAAATLARLEQIAVPVHWIRGNGERELAAAAAQPGDEPDPGDMAAVSARLTAGELGPARAKELGDHPLTLTIDGILFCHATPRRDDEVLTRISPQDKWDEAFASTTARLVVAGHTHQQHDRRAAATRYVNAGSVGLPYEGDGAARWIWIEDGEPELRSTPYDSAAAGRRMLEAGWPDERSIGAALIEPIDPMVVTRLFEGLD
jgi:predicted phosphodiesterase